MEYKRADKQVFKKIDNEFDAFIDPYGSYRVFKAFTNSFVLIGNIKVKSPSYEKKKLQRRITI